MQRRYAHRTFAPPDRRGGGSGGGGPSSEGLILWLKGDAGVVDAGGGNVSGWLDQSGFSQDHDSDNGGHRPKTGIANIDGINCVSFAFADTAYVQRVGGINDRNGNLMGYGIGESPAITVYAVFRPGETSFDFYGGEIFHRVGGTQPPFQALFDLEHTNRPDGFWLFSNGWRNYAESNRGPDTPPATYDGIPTMGTWYSSAHPAIDCKVNGAVVPLTPATMQGAIGGPTVPRSIVGNVLLSGFGLSFVADIPELLVYDYNVPVDNPAADAVNEAYLRGRFPSVP